MTKPPKLTTAWDKLTLPMCCIRDMSIDFRCGEVERRARRQRCRWHRRSDGVATPVLSTVTEDVFVK
jgi:hypothetical protein